MRILDLFKIFDMPQNFRYKKNPISRNRDFDLLHESFNHHDA